MAEKHSVSDAVMGAPDKIMSFETGQLAGLADGSVLAPVGQHDGPRDRNSKR